MDINRKEETLKWKGRGKAEKKPKQKDGIGRRFLVFLFVLFIFSAQPDQAHREDLTLELWNSSISSIWKFEINIFLRFISLFLIKNKVEA